MDHNKETKLTAEELEKMVDILSEDLGFEPGELVERVEEDVDQLIQNSGGPEAALEDLDRGLEKIQGYKPRHPQWEYNTISIELPTGIQQLNSYGKDGWELVVVLPGIFRNGKSEFIFKRLLR